MTEPTIKALIVDDERGAREILHAIIKDYFSNIEIVELCDDMTSCVAAIRKHKPDLVFLDIEMPGNSGLELMDFLQPDELNFEIIFVTAYSDYALQAFRLSALDYLLKPIQITYLEEAINKFKKAKNYQSTASQLEVLKNNLTQHQPVRICIPSSEGKYFFDINELIYFKADGAYSEIFTTSKGRIYVGKKLKYFEDMLTEQMGFLRIHRSYLINVRHITMQSRTGSHSLIMSNGNEVAVAGDRTKEIMTFVKNYLINSAPRPDEGNTHSPASS